MKKFFAIVVLGLFWSTYVYAIKFEKCYDVPFNISKLPKELRTIKLDGSSPKTKDGKTTNDYILEYFLKYNQEYNESLFDASIFETKQYQLFVKNKLIQNTSIFTDKAFIDNKKSWEELGLGKINQFNYPIIYFTENYIEAGSKRDGYVRLNLKNGTVINSITPNFNAGLTLQHCKSSSVKSKKGLTTNQERGTFKSILGNVIGK